MRKPRIYLETKNLTPEHYKTRLGKITGAASKKYGFKVVSNAK